MKKVTDMNTLLARAEQGDNKARNWIGLRYYHGRGGVEQNYEEAVKWFKAAGNYSCLGLCYLYGHGVEQNYEEAVKCFIAADNKEMLGECYLHGLGVERNVNKTIELWETASKERCRYYDVMLKLAHLYGDGIEMEPNYKEAIHWWNQLAENDAGEFCGYGSFAEALYQLACYFYEGKGVKKSVKWALKYFKYAINVFYNFELEGYDEANYVEYDRENHVIKNHSLKIETLSDEPDFIIYARKILAKHGQKSMINKFKKAAQNGDKKATEILNELGIAFAAPVQPEPVAEEPKAENVPVEKPKRKPPIQLTAGETVTHKIFGEGTVCQTDGGIVYVTFASVGKKKFSNPEAFDDNYLSLARLI